MTAIGTDVDWKPLALVPLLALVVLPFIGSLFKEIFPLCASTISLT